MSLRTVRVPAEMEGLFGKAEKVVSAYFGRRREQPDEGTIEIFGERYLLIRGASLSVEFFGVVRDLFGDGREREADEFARNILFDLAHAMGKSDARNFHAKMNLEDPIEKLSAGPVHFSHAGWAFVDISPDSVTGGKDEYFLLYDHPYSFESDAWVRSNRRSEFPVCIMNAGYSSGWCEESFGIHLVASEILCRARGDDCCRFVMAHPDHIEDRVGAYLQSEPEVARRAASYQIPDFFARKRLEDELRQAHDDLEVRVKERTEELRQANLQLAQEIEERAAVELKLLQAQKLEALGRLAGGIAHDFNNLLMVINGCTEILAGDLPPGEALGDMVAEISRAGERAAKLTEQLLVFSRQEVTRTEVVDLGQIVGQMSRMLNRLIGEDIELITATPEESALVRCNPGQMEQAVLNLIVNARDAVNGPGRISVTVDLLADEGSVRLRVADTGTGMSEHVLDHVFDPFFSTKGPGEGTGLGLSIVYGIVQQSGGKIDVDSAPGAGTTFTLIFPRASRPDGNKVTGSGQTSAAAGGRTILLVEDDDGVRRILARSLRLHGHEVLPAGSGAEALRVLEMRAGEVDLLITDVVMPGESGPDLARKIRAIDPEIKIIFMSGYTSDRIGKTGLAESDGVFLQKPLRLVDLERTIRELFAKG